MAERSSLVRLQEEYDLALDWHGYELHPDTPPGGRDLASRFGGKERVAAMHARLREFARSFGITDMELRDRSPNTRRALAIAEYAREQGKLEPWRQLAMDAHWRRGLDLESEADLRALALEAGLDPGSAIAASTGEKYLSLIDHKRAEAEELGVTGIPTFVVGRHGVVGCQPYEVLARFLESQGAQKR